MPVLRPCAAALGCMAATRGQCVAVLHDQHLVLIQHQRQQLGDGGSQKPQGRVLPAQQHINSPHMLLPM
jgi:hypothetical protein